MKQATRACPARIAALARATLGLSAVLSGIVALSGCPSSPDRDFYALYPEAGVSVGARPLRVELRRPGLPGYLDRPHIVRRVESGRLELAGNDWWGSPLEEMVGATVAENLAQRLPDSAVYTEAGAISTRPDVVVELQIQRFEPTEGNSVELLAQVALHFAGVSSAPALTRHELVARAHDSSTAEVVDAMSRLLADLSDAIARSIAQGAAPHPAGPAKTSRR